MLKKIESLHVKNKIRAAIMLVIVAFMFSLLMNVVGMLIMNGQFKEFYYNSYEVVNTQFEIRENLQVLGKHTLWVITDSSNPERRAEHQKLVDGAREHIDEYIEDLLEMKKSETQKEHVEEIANLWESTKVLHDQVIECVYAKDIVGAITVYTTTFEEMSSELNELLEHLGADMNEVAGREYRTARNTDMGSIIFLFITATVALITGFKMTNLLTKVITTPILEMTSAAEKIAQGDLDVNITHESTDELGDMAKSFSTMCNMLKNIIADLSYVLDELKNGNFNASSKNKSLYIGAFEKIIDNVYTTAINQSNTLEHINNIVAQVSLGAEQLADGAQNIAEGAANQSVSIKDLSNAIVNITNISADSTTKALETVGNVRIAVENAEQGKTDAAKLTDAMQRIIETSREIENIIADIEDIASQTNLLSLNASIEAARAGEAGRGFAVVADEIRKLAEQSSNSANNTRDLIDKTLAEIQRGNQIVDSTTAIMAKTIEDMEHFEVTANNMSKAFQAQSEMIKDVETSITQITDVVDNNSATAQETSAVSEELSAQAISLKELTGQFTFRK